jgi:predicted acyl esterase
MSACAVMAIASAPAPACAEAVQPAAGEGSGAHATAYPGRKWEPGPALYGATIVDDVPVTMDDGVVLRASIAYPTDPATGKRAAGRFPVVIEHTPYVRLGQPVTPNTYLTEHGYIYVLVRARGTGASGGEMAFFAPREGLDGKEIIDWAAHRLEGADGRIALIGCSFPAGIALTDAAYVGPNSPVKAVIAACNGLEQVNRETWFIGGLPTTGGWNFTSYAPNLMGRSPASMRFFEQMSKGLEGGGEPAYAAFWRNRTPMSLAQNIVDNGIPVLLWSGWNDIVETGALRAYAALQNAYDRRPVYAAMAPDQPVTPRYQIIMGNWEHAGGLDAGVYLEWLETWLKGVDTGIEKTTTPMHLFEAGSGRWINAARYPIVADSASWRLGSGVLQASPSAQAGAETLTWGDPAQPGSRLTYTSPPLPEGATLAGPISATIYAASSKRNLELIARLFDVAPDGSAAQISLGAVLGSQRALDPAKTWRDHRGAAVWPWPRLEGDDYLTPGEVYRFEIGLAPRQWGVAPGHRLRLELTSQTPGEVCPPSGRPAKNGDDPCKLTAPQRSTVPGGVYKILYGPKWPSALNLPQLPWSAFPSAAAGVPPTAWSENQRRLETREVTLPLDWGSSK